MPIPSVRSFAPALHFLLFAICPFFAQAQLQGKWECSTKSGHYDPNTHYEIKCGGILNFKSDRILESTCVDGFFPSGAYWEVSDKRLILRDSGGKAFADFEIRELSGEKLLLLRKEVQYTFRRMESVASNGTGQRP